MAATPKPWRLWIPLIAPITWSLHFTVSYIWLAAACGRFGGADASARAITGVGSITALAVLVMIVCLVAGARHHGGIVFERSNDDATPGDRRRFMALTTVLLAALSLLGTISIGGAVMAYGTCP